MRDDRLRDDPVLGRVLLARRRLSTEDLSPTGERAIAIRERVLRAEMPRPEVRRRSARVLFAVAFPALTVSALVLLIAGVFSGPEGSGAQLALAAVIRRVEQATAFKPGTIVVSETRTVAPHRRPLVVENIWETPAGSGPQHGIHIIYGPNGGAPNAWGVNGGNEEVYVRKTNTIYISSIWGPYITNGPRQSTFIYKAPKSSGSGALAAKPLRLTAAQAHALRNGSKEVVPNVSLKPKPHLTLAIAPVPQVPGINQGLRMLLRSRGFRIVGLTTVDGRRAIELAGRRGTPHAGNDFWVDPKTYTPIKRAIDSIPSEEESETWIKYETLPITRANQRLLNLIARFPHARIDRNHSDYLRAANGFQVLEN